MKARPTPAATPAVTAEGETFQSAPRRLRYTDVEAPAPGTARAIAPGVQWGRIPLPMDLDHINVWLVDLDDGCVIVDTGMAVEMGKEAWERIALEHFASRPVRLIFLTHIHPDHIGLAAWLQDRYGVPVHTSPRTREIATFMFGGEQTSDADAAEAFFRSHGIADADQLRTMFRPERFQRMVSGLPRVDREILDGEVLRWSADWTALETNGHAEGHLCLHNAAQRVLISGDQVLPTISSNIAFTWRNGDGNPLGSYLASLARLKTLPEDTLVLPSHGEPFRALHPRVDDLAQHHHEQLAKLIKACAEPRTAAELLPVLFRRELRGMHLFLGLAEALAHLEYLVHEGRFERSVVGGATRYRAT